MKIYISDFCSYRPSLDNLGEQPKLEYADALFRRRLSQITRMTIEVVHNLIQKNPSAKNAKLVFSSFRGEIVRQLKINKGLVEDADVMPAPFSLSVFNTPPAAATIVEGITAGYTAVYPAEDDFKSALIAAASAVFAGTEDKIIFVYADEKIPDEYKDCKSYSLDSPLAFACLLSDKKSDGAQEFDTDRENLLSPQSFAEFFERN